MRKLLLIMEKLDMKDEHKVLGLNALVMFLIRVFRQPI